MWRTGAALILAFSVLALLSSVRAGATDGDIGYRGPSFIGASASPSGSKPESKLWWNDGSWWASMFDTVTLDFHIFKLDLASQTWIDTGVALDGRITSRADTLWDGSHLYVASHVYAAVKTSFTASLDPLIMLLVREPATGDWASHVFGRNADDHTRPIVLIDEGHGALHMFATAPESGGTIYEKVSPLDPIAFPDGLGAPVIRDVRAPT